MTPDGRLTTWRIVRRAFRTSAASGEGAAMVAGRWNRPGQRVVYTADTMALAALEVLVHVDDDLALVDFSLVPCTFDNALVGEFDSRTLPHGWTRDQAVTRAIAGDWLEDGKLPVLRVPTAIVPLGWNYLLNPAHPDFGTIKFGLAVPFIFDARLGGR